MLPEEHKSSPISAPLNTSNRRKVSVSFISRRRHGTDRLAWEPSASLAQSCCFAPPMSRLLFNPEITELSWSY
ncbi:hypothetical protein EYF80_029989 [Liparis tanakae]|uniref:Uncharacterized protein n=1 Tax=Liparis tanakae TaxID=230148 RepID=A0A4Z2H4R1_9TELE|nr:hypothetical protein EYF80_029989 [Liparis tanakae]